jgi:uncharacterized membrane protein
VTHHWLRPAGVAALIITYALLQHYANTTAAAAPLGSALAVTPLLATWLAVARRTPWPRSSVMLAAVIAGWVLIKEWSRIEHSFPLMFMLQEAGIYLMLAFGFGRSLLPGQTPLCMRWATMVHGPLSEAAARYTRSVTFAWTLFLTGIGLTSVLLYALAPVRSWSIFSNFMTLPLAALMFAIEYEIRRHRLPGMQRASLADTVRAYAATTTRRRTI